MVQLFPGILPLLLVAFVLAFLASIGWLVYGIFRHVPPAQSAGPLVAVLLVYVVLLFGGSAVSRERRVPLGTAMCFDDWCAAVTALHGAASTADRIVSADVRVSSVAKRVTQRGSNPRIFFIDDRGTWHEAKVPGSFADLRSEVGPGESFTTRVEAAIPANARVTAIRIWEGGLIDRFVPFDEESPFHQKTYYDVASS